MSTITIKDVAAKAGVTVTTVSRVLNNRGYISENTKEKVYAAMDELNYRPNEMARFLSKQQTNYIGIVLPSAEHPFFGKVLHWFEHYASLHGYKVMVGISTIHQPIEEMCQYTIETIIKKVNNEVIPSKIMLPVNWWNGSPSKEEMKEMRNLNLLSGNKRGKSAYTYQ